MVKNWVSRTNVTSMLVLFRVGSRCILLMWKCMMVLLLWMVVFMNCSVTGGMGLQRVAVVVVVVVVELVVLLIGVLLIWVLLVGVLDVV